MVNLTETSKLHICNIIYFHSLGKVSELLNRGFIQKFRGKSAVKHFNQFRLSLDARNFDIVWTIKVKPRRSTSAIKTHF